MQGATSSHDGAGIPPSPVTPALSSRRGKVLGRSWLGVDRGHPRSSVKG